MKSRKRDADRPRSSISMVDYLWPVYALSEGVVQTKLKLAEPSVVVSTYNRGEVLPGAIQSLREQDLDRSGYEIVIVDNNATDHSRQVVGSFTGKAPEVLSESHRAGRTTCIPLEVDRTRNRSDEPRSEESRKSWQMALTGPLPDEGAVCR